MSKALQPALVRRQRTRPHVSRLVLLAVVIDTMLLIMGTLVAASLRTSLSILQDVGEIPDTVLHASVFIIVGWLVTLLAVGAYDETYFAAGADEYRRVFTASLIAGGLVGIGCFLLQFPLSRAFYVLLFVIGIPILLLGRFALRRAIQRLRSKQRLTRRVLIAGAPRHIEGVAKVLMRESWLGYSTIGCVTAHEHPYPETLTGIPILGRTADVAEIVADNKVDVLLIAEGAFAHGDTLRQTAWELEGFRGLQLAVVPSLTDVSAQRVEVRPIAGLPLVYIGHPRAQDAAHWGKRMFDIVGSLALLVLTAPVWLWVALLVKADDRGPVLFRQTRVGRDGDTFECLKFRTMVLDAEAMLPSLGGVEEGQVLFKMRADPRVTKPGRVLRRFSLDELPQLVNVLRGDMSLVGPRPPLPSEVVRYESDANRRLHVRPGMTGLWQISGRSNLTWDETVRLDLYYVDNWSFIQDVMILLKTVSAVAAARGAY